MQKKTQIHLDKVNYCNFSKIVCVDLEIETLKNLH